MSSTLKEWLYKLWRSQTMRFYAIIQNHPCKERLIVYLEKHSQKNVLLKEQSHYNQPYWVLTKYSFYAHNHIIR